MAGVKGRSGGKREGAGRKPKAADPVSTADPMQFLLDVMKGLIDPSPSQLKAAQTAARLLHGVPKEKGKKEQREEAAKEAAQGRFKAASAPRLAAVDGKAVGSAS